MPRRRSGIQPTVAVLTAAVVLTGCLSTPSAEEEGTQAQGLRIGVKVDQPGMGQLVGDQHTGLDVQVAREVAERLGYEEENLEWVEAPTPRRELMLQSGDVDMIVATYSITQTRKERVQFAGPYLVAGQSLLVRSDDDISGLEDLNAGQICTVSNSTSAAELEDRLSGEFDEHSTYSQCVEDLANGRVGAVSTDDAILAGFAAQEGFAGLLEVAGEPFTVEEYGIGLAPTNPNCEQINDIVEDMWDDGTMDELIENNLGASGHDVDRSENPPEVGGHCS